MARAAAAGGSADGGWLDGTFMVAVRSTETLTGTLTETLKVASRARAVAASPARIAPVADREAG